MTNFAFAPLRDLLPDKAVKLLAFTGDALDEIGFTEFDVVSDGAEQKTKGKAVWLKEIEFPIPGFEMASVALLESDALTEVDFTWDLRPEREITVTNLGAALRINAALLNRVHQDADGKWVRSLDADGRPLPVEIDVSGVNVVVKADWDVEVSNTPPALTLPPVELGETGIVLEMRDIALYVSSKQTPPPGAAAGFKGVTIGEADVHFTRGVAVTGAPSTVALTDTLIGSAGFSGHITAEWTDTGGSGSLSGLPGASGSLFGLPFVLQEVDVAFKQNVPVGGGLKGIISLPFFDQPVGVDVSYGVDGALSVSLAAVQPDLVTSSGGLISFTIPDLLSMSLDSIGFTVADGEAAVTVSGQLTPLAGGLSWPTFDIKELSIDSKGDVKLQGGWLDLASQYSLDLSGFSVEITKIGFGKAADGGKWIGFSGSLHLVEGLPAGASVEGLRLTWYADGRQPKLTLEGAGVDFEIPDVLKFKGSVSLREFDVITIHGHEWVRRFDGDISLELVALGVTVDGTLVIGTAKPDHGPRYRFFAIYLDVELPVGIPVAATGVSLFGFAGLFADNMEPDRQVGEAWYGVGANDGWYHRVEPGVTNLEKKWRNEHGSVAFGAGVTLGTGSDNGFTFSAKVLFLIIFPGPIIMLEGKANLMKERAKLGDEALFRSLAVLDFAADNFVVGLDAQYKTGSSGELIDLKVGAEAFFDFNDPLAWHVYLGEKEPRERRIRAALFRIFDANSYLMIDAHKLQTGVWVGFAKSWSFGPVGLTIEAWIEGNAAISWKPAHFYGDLWLHGQVAIRVFRFRLGLTVDARVSADVFHPFHVRAEISASVDLPRPFKSRSVHAVIEWGGGNDVPPVPLVLQDVAVEHLLTTTTWPLTRGSATVPAFIKPNYDSDGDGFVDAVTFDSAALAAVASLAPPSDAPIVPIDARPRLTFARPVNDDAHIGVNLQPVVPEYETIGDPTSATKPYTARFALSGLVLSAWTGATWTPVASAPQGGGLRSLYGSWAPVPAVPDGDGPNFGQVKLWLWSKTPFDYTRNTSRAWDDWFTGHYSGYPCIAPAAERTFCCDFEAAPVASAPGQLWAWPDHEQLTLAWPAGLAASVIELASPVDGLTHALCVAPLGAPRRAAPSVEVRFAEAAQHVTVLLYWPPAAVARQCADFRRDQLAPGPNPRQRAGAVFTASGVRPRPRNTVIGQVATSTGPLPGLVVGRSVIIDLPRDSDFAEVTLTASKPGVVVSVFDAAGGAVAATTVTAPARVTVTARLDGAHMRRIVVAAGDADAFVHQVCFAAASAAPKIEAVATDNKGRHSGPFPLVGSTIKVTGDDVAQVLVRGDRPFCVVRVCVNLGPDPAYVALREELDKHASDELARWSQAGDVLEPHTSYRLTVVTTVTSRNSGHGDVTRTQTEYAYFTTGAPPGLGSYSRPSGVAPDAVFATGLEDLTRYVHQTVPATVPGAGEQPPLPRPVYRAYDVGVEFNQDYVDLMYRLDRRDLALQLYDVNDRPVRDARGRLVAVANNWGVTEQLSLSDSDDRWIAVLNASGCRSVDTEIIPHQVTIAASSQGQVLDADMVYEARLVPLLLQEPWATETLGATANGPAGVLGGWSVVDLADPAAGGPSTWAVAAGATGAQRVVRQTSAIAGGHIGVDADQPGTVLLVADRAPLTPPGEQPGAWRDYRFTVTVRGDGDGALGVVFRYRDPMNYYRFSMDRGRRRRQLVRVAAGVATVVAEDDEAYRQGFDYVVAVAAVGSSIDVQVDGELLFAVDDTALDHGRVGLYCWANDAARFADVRVEDFRAAAPVAYRFKFTTSNFANFFHHLHSFGDQAWTVALPAAQFSDTDMVTVASHAVTVNGPPLDAEIRAFDAFAAAALGAAANQDPPKVEVSRVQRPSGDALALMVRSPEPIDWSRTTLDVEVSASSEAAVASQSTVKVTDVTFAAGGADDESVTVLALDAVDLTRWRVERRDMTDRPRSRAGEILFVDDEHRRDPALVGRVGPFTVGVLDPGTGVPQWRVARGVIAVSAAGGASVAVSERLALSDYRVTLRLHSDGAGAVGMVFRYVDEANHYRFTLAATPPSRRLERVHGGVVTALWSDSGTLPVGPSVTVAVEAAGRRLRGWVDGSVAFDVTDGALGGAGAVGLYCAGSDGARFERVEVRACSLWTDRFHRHDSDGWLLAGGGWSTSGGGLVHVASSPGATAIGGDSAWADVVVSADLHADSGAVGLMFRCVDAAHWYRFALGGSGGKASLVKQNGNVATQLWAGPALSSPNPVQRVSVVADGSTLRGFVDGVPVFAVDDADHPAGGIGLWADGDARVANVRVDALGATMSSWLLDERFAVDTARRWRVIDETTASGPSLWSFGDGEARQTSAIGETTRGEPRLRLEAPDRLGTEIVAGDARWSDYRLTVRLATGGSGAIGVVFRFADQDNCYRFSMDPQGPYRRLVKKAGGQLTTLWHDTTAVTTDDEHVVTVDCAAGRLTGYLDGDRIFAVDDDSVVAGRVGLYCSANSTARFQEVRVAPPSWSGYYTFGTEEPQPAGTQVHLRAANEEDASAAAVARPGHVNRYIASFGDHGDVRLTGDTVRLRVVDAHGNSRHERTFLTPSAFSAANLRILRKSDGTALFLIPTPSTATPATLPRGGYRLKFNYRRDNRAAEATSQLFKQAGETVPETATIDVPWATRP